MLATTIQITNNPPHTTHTQKPSGWLRGQPPPTGGRRSHGVEREPDSVSARKKLFMPTHETRTHTHHPLPGSKHMQAQENNQAQPKQSCRTVPHKNGLPRKEVIQPHLPVRLPCYDFVPIANPTFDHSPRTSRLGHGLRVLPTFVT